MKKKTLLKSLAISLCTFTLLSLSNIVNIQKVSAATTAPEITGESAITMDMDTGEVIYSKNADVKRSPASTTKLMTALLLAENKAKTDKLAFSSTSLKVTESGLSTIKHLNPGDKISADDAMKALLVYSANDSAYVIAEAVSGSVGKFVDMMNSKAKELGLKNTHFVNPCGLETNMTDTSNKEINQTTAYDLTQIGIAAYKNDWVREVLQNQKDKVTIDLAGSKFPMESRNFIIGKNGNVGGKTGTEDQAGHCFVGFYERDNRKVVTVVLKDELGHDGVSVFHSTEKIADYSYADTKDKFKSSGDIVGTADLSYKPFGFFGADKTISAPIILKQDVTYYKNDFNDKTASISYTDSKSAWSLSTHNSVDLNFSTLGHSEKVSGIVKISFFDIVKQNMVAYFLSILMTVIILVLIIFIIRIINFKKRKKRKMFYNRY